MSSDSPLAVRLELARTGVSDATQSSEDAAMEILGRLELVLSAATDVDEAVAEVLPGGHPGLLGPMARIRIAIEEAMNLLQAQDIVSQRLVYVGFLLDDVLENHENPEGFAPLGDAQPANADPNATMAGRAGRQALADDIFG